MLSASRRSLLRFSRPLCNSQQTLTGFEPSLPYVFEGPYLNKPVEDAPSLEEWRKHNHDPLGHLNAADRQKVNDETKIYPYIFRKQGGYIYNKEVGSYSKRTRESAYQGGKRLQRRHGGR